MCDRWHESYRITRPGECCGEFVRGTSAPLPGPDLDTCLIPLTLGQFAIVDAADYEWLSQWKWYANKTPKTYYAARRLMPTRKTISMHRLITDAPAGLSVDHIDRNGLNNTRKNLRLCTHRQNMYNQGPRKNSSSKYKGVKWHKSDKRFGAGITHDGKGHYLGSFKDEIAAAKAYDKKAKELFGKFAYLNFPEENQ